MAQQQDVAAEAAAQGDEMFARVSIESAKVHF